MSSSLCLQTESDLWPSDQRITTFFFLHSSFQRLVFLFLCPWNLISLTWKRPLSLVLINLLLKRLKQKKVICCQLKLLVMESPRHPMMAEMITYFLAIYFNSLYMYAIPRPICESKESSFSIISLMEAVRWSYQSHHNQEEIQLFNICHQNHFCSCWALKQTEIKHEINGMIKKKKKLFS